VNKTLATIATLPRIAATLTGINDTAQAVTCIPFQVSKSERVYPRINKWVDVTATINAETCAYSSGVKRVNTVSFTVAYNRQGTSESCGIWDANEGVTYDLYIMDGRGANYHHPQVRLPCSKDTTAERTWALVRDPQWHWCFGAPKWKVNGTVRVDLNPDTDFTLKGNLWTFIGPVPNDC